MRSLSLNMTNTIGSWGAWVLIFSLPSLLANAQGKTRDYSKVLPGVIKVSDYLYYDKTEITNIDWMEYLHWQRKNNGGVKSDGYLESLPDTASWSIGLDSVHPYEVYYLRHPAYSNYPVVGVTWKQATHYCSWRTERVKEYLGANNLMDKAPFYFAYRLPTEEEFLLMYDDAAGMTNRIGKEGKRKYRGMYRFNMHKDMLNYQEESNPESNTADVTAPAKSYWPNQFGVYNIRGNVAEWLSTPYSYAGGSWRDPFDSDVRTLQFDGSSSPVNGFRCVCETATEAP